MAARKRRQQHSRLSKEERAFRKRSAQSFKNFPCGTIAYSFAALLTMLSFQI